MFMYTVVDKFLLYPTLVAAYCGRNLCFAALLNILLEGGIIFLVCLLCSKTNRTFFEILKASLGDIPARIVIGLVGLYFLAASVVPLFEQKLYVHEIFYDNVSSLVVFVPIFIFLVFAAAKGLESVGRGADICLPIFVLCILAIFLMSIFKADFSNLLPILSAPAKGIFSGAYKSLFRFNGGAIMLVLAGRFKYTKGDSIKITLSYFGGAFLLLLFLGIFYGMYGNISQSVQFAIARLSLFFPAIDIIGRVDLIVLYTLEVVMLFALALNLQLSVVCLRECFGVGENYMYSLAINFSLFLVLVLCENLFSKISNFFENWMWIAFVLFSFVLPIFVVFMGLKNPVQGVKNAEKVD